MPNISSFRELCIADTLSDRLGKGQVRVEELKKKQSDGLQSQGAL